MTLLEVKVFLDQDDMHDGTPLYEHIMHMLMRHHIAGASIFTAFGGYGHEGHLNFPRRLGASDQAPLMILFIDREEKVREVLPHVRQALHDGLIVSTPVDLA